MTRHLPYKCPSCGYESVQKSSMRKHFYGKKKPCLINLEAQSLNFTELTEEIKQCVLANRCYHIPKPSKVKSPHTIINQTVNNYNQMNNFLNTSMPPMDRLNHILNHKNVDLIDFADKVEDTYSNEIQVLNEDADEINLDGNDILTMINALCKSSEKSCEDMNIMYDEIANNISIFNDGCWKESGVDKGLVHIIELLKEAYLDRYESHLLRRIYQGPYQSRKESEEYLCEYYQFIASFGLQPYVQGKTDACILNVTRRRDSFEIEEKYRVKFNAIKDKLSKGEKNLLRNKVHRILKNAAKNNVKELNRRIMDLCGVDEEFKSKVMDNITNVLVTPAHSLT